MEPIEIPGLSPAERAFLLDTGERVVVRITSKQTTDARFIALAVQARLVDEAGGTLKIGGVDAVCPGSVRSISTDALAAGSVTIQSEMATATVEACVKARRHGAALRAWAALPAES